MVVIRASAQDILGTLDGTFSRAHLIEPEVHFNVIDCLEVQITELNKEIRTRIAPYQEISDQLMRIPGINQMTIEVILAEIGPSVAAFKSEKHLASWAGLCPCSYESGGIRKSAHITKGNKYLRTALYHARRTAGHSSNPILPNFISV